MDITKALRLPPGHYIAAISGGVDSMVLLDALVKRYGRKGSEVRLTIAHFDHGIREASHFDRALVHEVAGSHGLPFVYEEGRLGPGASEDTARQARYEFLKKVQRHAGARGIVTAHHLDDVVETAVLNMIRGTGRKGMTALEHGNGLHRPFRNIPKEKLRAYAQANGLVWHEDATNSDERYRRNYIRHTVLARLRERSPEGYRQLLALIRRQRELNRAIDDGIELLLHQQPTRRILERRTVAALPYKLASELVASWLRQNGKRQTSRWLIDRLTVALRTAQPGTAMLLDGTCKVVFSDNQASFVKV